MVKNTIFQITKITTNHPIYNHNNNPPYKTPTLTPYKVYNFHLTPSYLNPII
jgi:hypothetical protein